MKLCWLPLILCFCLFLAIFVSYSIAVSLDHVHPFLPYISDAGVLIPERSVFSELINLGVIMHLIFSLARYEHVKLAKDFKKDSVLFYLNRISLYLGLVIAFGLSLIANFQLESNGQPELSALQRDKEEKNPTGQSNSSVQSQTSPSSGGHASLSSVLIYGQSRNPYTALVQKIHWTGAFFAFVGSIVWMWLQSALTWRMAKKSKGLKYIAIVRGTFSIVSLTFLCLGIGLALTAATRDEVTGEVIWNDNLNGLERREAKLSLAAASCEWIVTFTIAAFFLTYIREFRGLRIQRPRIVAHVHHPPGSVSSRPLLECKNCRGIATSPKFGQPSVAAQDCDISDQQALQLV